MIKKLRKRFIRISTIAVSSVMILLFISLNIFNFISVNSKLNNTLNMIIKNQGTMPDFNDRQTPPGMDDKKPDDMDMNMNMNRGQFNEETPFSTRYFVLCYDAQGQKISSNLEKIAAVTEEDTQEYITLALKKGEGSGFTDGYKYMTVLQSDGSYMTVFLNDEKEISSANTIFFVSLGATVACICLICIIIVLFSKRAIDPVIQSNQKQKQFITDASHELKTPITVINTSLSVLEMEVGKQKWIDKAKAQTEKLKDLVNSLVTLSRMDEENPINKREFNISETLKETAESFADFAESQGHRLEIDITPDLQYFGDEYSLRQLTSILIENAVKYASACSPIKFKLLKDKKSINIITENEADNIDVSELDKLFDRFYRADKARSEKSGFGIGLSIARSICETHSGDISATSDDGKTIRFTARIK